MKAKQQRKQQVRAQRHQVGSATNRKAGFDVAVATDFEAGIVLTGDEIKSIRANRIQLNGSYVKLLYGSRHSNQVPQVVLIGSNLSAAADPQRVRSLLLHAREVREIEALLGQRGHAAVPLKMYLKRGWAKVLIGVGPGRKQHDKRQLLKHRDLDRELRREGKVG
jgi:SsrA-binding protein